MKMKRKKKIKNVRQLIQWLRVVRRPGSAVDDDVTPRAGGLLGGAGGLVPPQRLLL